MNSLQIFLFACSAALVSSHWTSSGLGWSSHGNHGGGWGRPNKTGWGQGAGLGPVPTSPPNAGVPQETRTMDALYKRALAEGGKLVVYAGGDAPNQQDDTKKGFQKAFPGVTVEIVVDFSKYHDARIDYQLATNSVVLDIAQLQTLQDFPRWKEEGVLLNYKPLDWNHIYPQFKDPQGAYTGVFMSAFSNNINANLLPNNATWPINAKDYLKPEFKNKIVVTYPNDDDAVLYWFYMVVKKYGFGYLDKFKAQNPKLVRGTATSSDMVAQGSYVATMSADGGIRNYPGLPKFVVPTNDPFVLWPQTAAIFKKSRHPETAKLYMSWILNKQKQDTDWSWSVRDDVTPPAPFKSIWSYPEADPTAFARFMADRTEVEKFRSQIGLIFGQVQGPSPNGDFDMHPVVGKPY